jgi:TonB family protein
LAKTSGQTTEIILADSNFVYKPSNKLAEQSTAKKYEQNTLNDIAATESKQVTTNAAPASVSNNQAERENVKPVYQADAEKDFAKAKNADKDNKELQLTKVFSAQVVGPDNTPLPFANINIKTENFGTYTDVKGNFRLVSSDSILTVEVKSAGYQTQFYTLKSSLTQNKIILPEVDVTNRQTTVISSNKAGRSKLSKRATLLKDSVVDVEPADGWDNYNTYVDNNIDIPDDILKKNVHGQVELSFDVKPNGAITNIKVDKSLCNNCDEAAKQLLQQGPKWKTKNGKKGKAKVTVQF